MLGLTNSSNMGRAQMAALVAIAVALGLLAWGSNVLAKTSNEPPEMVTVDGCQKKKRPVTWPHKLHWGDLKLPCETCHHNHAGMKQGDGTEVKLCSGCHLKPEKPEIPNCTTGSTKKNAYHITCVGCHKEEAKKNPEKAHIKKCTNCHKK